MKILIAGGTGFVGNYLRQHLLSQYHEVYFLSRRVSDSAQSNLIFWDPSQKIIDSSVQLEFDAVVNLAGENIGSQYWTKARKELLRTSRINSVEFLKELIDDGRLKTAYFLQASAIGFYGDRAKEKLREDSAPGKGFLAELVQDWENTTNEINVPHSIMRFGIVFHSHDGAFKKMVIGLKFRICLILGTGLNYISWIDIDDLCRMILFLIEQKKVGIYNAVSPQPIQNIFMLKKFIKKFGGLTMTIMIPARIIRWILGDFSEMFLYSQKVSCRKIEEEGFDFHVKNFNDFLQKYAKKFS